MALLGLGVTQLGCQAEGDMAWAWLHPHLGFPARGQWEPLSHWEEVLGPKQEVALQAENPSRIPRALRQVAGGAEPDEADGDIVTPIWIFT